MLFRSVVLVNVTRIKCQIQVNACIHEGKIRVHPIFLGIDSIQINFHIMRGDIQGFDGVLVEKAEFCFFVPQEPQKSCISLIFSTSTCAKIEKSRHSMPRNLFSIHPSIHPPFPKFKDSYLTAGATLFAARGDAGAKADAALALRTRAARVRRGAMVDIYESWLRVCRDTMHTFDEKLGEKKLASDGQLENHMT